MDFPDSTCELSLLITLIINFHMNTTFPVDLKPLMDTYLHVSRRDVMSTKNSLRSHLTASNSREKFS